MVTIQGPTQPVGLPGTSYAYDITVSSMSPISAIGHFTRANWPLARSLRASLRSASDLLGWAKRRRAFAQRDWANGMPLVTYRRRFVLGHGVVSARPSRSVGLVRQRAFSATAPRSHTVDRVTHRRGCSLLSTTSGAVLESLAFGVHVSDIAPSPDGNLLYVVLDELLAHPDSKVSTVIDEVSTATGRVIAHQAIEFGVGGAVLTPVQGGVWVRYRGGMARTSVLYRSAGLARVVWPKSAPAPFTAVPRYGGEQIMGFSATWLGGSLWLRSGSGMKLSRAFDWQVLGWDGLRHFALGSTPWAPFASWDGLLYATGADGIENRLLRACAHLWHRAVIRGGFRDARRALWR